MIPIDYKISILPYTFWLAFLSEYISNIMNSFEGTFFSVYMCCYNVSHEQ